MCPLNYSSSVFYFFLSFFFKCKYRSTYSVKIRTLSFVIHFEPFFFLLQSEKKNQSNQDIEKYLWTFCNRSYSSEWNALVLCDWTLGKQVEVFHLVFFLIHIFNIDGSIQKLPLYRECNCISLLKHVLFHIFFFRSFLILFFLCKNSIQNGCNNRLWIFVDMLILFSLYTNSISWLVPHRFSSLEMRSLEY